METIQIAIAIVIAMILAPLLIHTLKVVDFEETSENIQKTILDKQEFEFKTVNMMEFVLEVFSFWKEYQHSEGKATLTLYVDDEGYLDKTSFFSYFKENDLCRTIQSSSLGCGYREDTRIDLMSLPRIVKVVYANDTLFIKSGEKPPLNNRSFHILSKHFGGYVGSGRIDQELGIIPADSNINSFELEILTGTDFLLFINGYQCMDQFATGNGINRFDLMNCSEHISLGEKNSLTILFASFDIFRKYIAGGIVTLEYDSEESIPGSPPSSMKIPLPQIDGVIEYFGEINVPGSPTSAKLNIKAGLGKMFENEFSINVGGNNVYSTTSSGNVDIQKDITSSLREGVTPLQIYAGSYKDTESEIILIQPVDVVLITDESYSMMCDLDDDHPQNCALYRINGRIVYIDKGNNRGNNCNHPNLEDEGTEKLILAKCYGIMFAEKMLEQCDETKVGLVSFSYNFNSVLPLTQIMYGPDSISETIMRYRPGEGTCISCAIKRAVNVVEKSEIAKAMVIMTDGVGTACITGACSPAKAQAEAMEEATKAHNEHNISLYTIAFGLKTGSAGVINLEKIACVDNCSHAYSGNTANEIRDVYINISNDINEKMILIKRHVQGYRRVNFTDSQLKNSFIDINFVPYTSGSPAKVMVTLKLSSPSQFILPDGMVIEEAILFSWAGVFWTDYASLNNVPVLDLSEYDAEYTQLGDPFAIQLPVSQLELENTIEVKKGDIYEPQAGNVENITLRYIASVDQTRYNEANFINALGCHWIVEFKEGIEKFSLPSSYTGNNFCSYTTEKIEHDDKDLYQLTAYTLFEGLDHDSDGVVDDKIEKIFLLGGMPG